MHNRELKLYCATFSTVTRRGPRYRGREGRRKSRSKSAKITADLLTAPVHGHILCSKSIPLVSTLRSGSNHWLGKLTAKLSKKTGKPKFSLSDDFQKCQIWLILGTTKTLCYSSNYWSVHSRFRCNASMFVLHKKTYRFLRKSAEHV